MKPLGQIAYEAYTKFYGNTYPAYETLPAKIKEGLETGIDAVLESLPNENPALVTDLFNRCVSARGNQTEDYDKVFHRYKDLHSGR